jgi:hypothetical protein
MANAEHYTTLRAGEMSHKHPTCGCKLIRDPDGGDVRLYLCAAHESVTTRAKGKISDTQAVDQLRKWMSGRTWNDCADFLDAIAELVRSTGRRVADAKQDAKNWNE